MKTKLITPAVIAVVIVVIASSCGTARSYPESRRYPTNYPGRDRPVIIVRDHRPVQSVYRYNHRRPVKVYSNRGRNSRYSDPRYSRSRSIDSRYNNSSRYRKVERPVRQPVKRPVRKRY